MSELSAAKTAWEAPAHDTEDDTADSVKLARAFTYVAELEAALAERDRTIESLKCCGNCGHDKAADDCCDDCIAGDSRWTARAEEGSG